MTQTTIFEGINKLLKRDTVSFHVPGHKNAKIFEKYHTNFINNISKIDTTEIPGTDNLHNPSGIIKEAQEKCAEFYGSDKSYFLINGSTCGIYSMIMAVTSPGDKVIVQRDCHKSVINGIIMGGLIPIYIKSQIDTNRLIGMGVSTKEVEKALIDNPDSKAVIITYPNYYGVCSDIRQIAEIVHKYNKILLVDEAHGAHLRLSEKLPVSALDVGADIVVQSTHKTLTSFTQSSILHVKGNRVDIEKLKFMLSLHQSTSPSYILMASLDMAITMAKEEGNFLMEKLIDHINTFKSDLQNASNIDILSKEDILKCGAKDIDITKLVITMKDIGISGIVLEEILRKKYNIQMEMVDMINVTGVSSIANEKNDFNRLSKALKSIYQDGQVTHIKEELPEYSFMIPEMKVIPRDAIYKNKEDRPFVESGGLISGEYIIPYPPGIPLICPGEVITEELIEYVELLKSKEIGIVGTNDKRLDLISVIK